MKYVYMAERDICRVPPSNVWIRLLVGTLGNVVLVALLAALVETDDIGEIIAILVITLSIAITFFLLQFTAVRTLVATVRVRPRTPETVIETSPKRVFYSTTCPHCDLLIDYQRCDLSYRLWFIKGYVECTRCCKPIRHNTKQNKFIPRRYPEQKTL